MWLLTCKMQQDHIFTLFPAIMKTFKFILLTSHKNCRFKEDVQLHVLQ